MLDHKTSLRGMIKDGLFQKIGANKVSETLITYTTKEFIALGKLCSSCRKNFNKKGRMIAYFNETNTASRIEFYHAYCLYQNLANILTGENKLKEFKGWIYERFKVELALEAL